MNNDFGPHFVRLTDYTPEPMVVRLLPEVVARHHSVAPLYLEGDQLVVAAANPTDRRSLRAVASAVRRPVSPLLASYPEIRAILGRIYGAGSVRPPTLDLGQLLRQLGHLSEEGLRQALETQAETGESLRQICHRQSLVDDEDLTEAVAWQYHLPHLQLDTVKLQPGLTTLIPFELATDGVAIPLWWLGGSLIIGTTAPEKRDRLEAVANRLGLPVQPVMCDPTQWASIFRRYYLHGQREKVQDVSAITDILVRRGILSELVLRGARVVSQQTGQSLEEVLLDQGLVTPEQWLHVRTELTGVPSGSPPRTLPPGITDLLPAPVARAYGLLPLEQTDGRLIGGSNGGTSLAPHRSPICNRSDRRALLW